MTLTFLPHDFSVCKVPSLDPDLLRDPFCFVGKTDEELSLVCLTRSAPGNAAERDDGWKAFRIDGILDFSLIGILSRISGVLADARVGIFAVSTYNTDYVLIKRENETRAKQALRDAGYEVRE